MVRPKRYRYIKKKPNITYFKPAGVRMVELEEVILNVEEFEALRLSDLEELNQIEAANKMKVSQPTFNRLINSARKKVASAIVKGKAIRVEGGNYKLYD